MKQTFFLLVLLTMLLGAGVAIYGARIWQIYSSDLVAPELAQTAVTPEGSLGATLAPANFEPEVVDIEAILEKAVFEHARERPRPVPKVEPEAVPEPVPVVESGPKPLDIVILGIVLQDGGGVVLYQRRQGGLNQQITIGEKIDGWKLLELVGVEAVFEQDGERVRLQLPLE